VSPGNVFHRLIRPRSNIDSSPSARARILESPTSGYRWPPRGPLDHLFASRDPPRAPTFERSAARVALLSYLPFHRRFLRVIVL
jgi:hypothetical protein